MQKTNISWTDYTWNPIVGCAKISAGCLNCYAEEVANRFRFTDKPWAAKHAAENVQLKPERITEPMRRKAPTLIFTCSMSDIFHEHVPSDYIDEIFEVMRNCPRHTFQVLTKRPERGLSYPRDYPKNLWLGTSVEDRSVLHRIDTLRKIPAKLRFLSIEPLLEDLGELNLDGIHWVIVGGESGISEKSPKFRPMDPAWGRDIRDQCEAQDVPFFFKQSAGLRANHQPYLTEANGEQRMYREMPHTYRRTECQKQM